MNKQQILQQWIAESKQMVFFGGAGVSTESGIPDFRSQDGLYHQQYQNPPETILSRAFYQQYPEEFYRFYRDKMLCLTAKPNLAHHKLAEWERSGKLKAVITQNIDGLHQAAGSKQVLELHGSIHRNYCQSCGRFYSVETLVQSQNIPRCECGGQIKPDVVLYGEGLNQQIVQQAVAFICSADLLIVAGTSLAVYPAAGLIEYYQGNRLVLVNRTATSFDSNADLLIQTNVGELFGTLSETD